MGDFIRYYDDVDVTVAVQTPNGLMVPIVKHADELGLLEISAQVKALAKKVRPTEDCFVLGVVLGPHAVA